MNDNDINKLLIKFIDRTSGVFTINVNEIDCKIHIMQMKNGIVFKLIYKDEELYLLVFFNKKKDLKLCRQFIVPTYETKKLLVTQSNFKKCTEHDAEVELMKNEIYKRIGPFAYTLSQFNWDD